MTIPHPADAPPLRSDEDVLQRASLLLDTAIRRQLWLMFLDERGRQLPVLMPSYVPRIPTRQHRDDLHRMLGVIFEDVDADSMVIAYERRGPDVLSAGDRAWLALIRDACREAAIPLRGPLLVHDRGVRWIAPEDLG